MSEAQRAGEFRVPPEHPCLAGHFPGAPIVPAVLILELACELVQGLAPQPGPLREVRHAKFSLPVRPGETVRVNFDAGEASGLVNLRCHTAAGLAVQAQLRFGDAS